MHFAFVSNSSPWTYANTRPVWTNPTTTFETGPRRVRHDQHERAGRISGLVRQMLSQETPPRGEHLIRDDDVAWVRVTADTPVACQIDGDYVGQRETMTFTVRAGCLGRGGTARENRLTCEMSASEIRDLGRKWSECSTNE